MRISPLPNIEYGDASPAPGRFLVSGVETRSAVGRGGERDRDRRSSYTSERPWRDSDVLAPNRSDCPRWLALRVYRFASLRNGNIGDRWS